MTLPSTRPATVCLEDPRPGTVVVVDAGTWLRLRFRRGLGGSGWHLIAAPGHVVPLAQGANELHFLVFEGSPGTLRLERRHPARRNVREICELRVEVRELEASAPAVSRRSA